MGFGGPSSQEKAQLGQTQGLIGTLAGQGTDSANREKKTFKQFEKSLTPVLDYWKAILSGDKVASSAAVAPTAEAVSEQYAGVEKGISALAPRSQTGRDVTALETKKASDISSLVENLQPQAAQALTQIAGLLSGTSQGFAGLATGATSSALQGSTAASQILSQWQQRQMQFWGDIIGGALGAGGAALGGFLGRGD